MADFLADLLCGHCGYSSSRFVLDGIPELRVISKRIYALHLICLDLFCLLFLSSFLLR